MILCVSKMKESPDCLGAHPWPRTQKNDSTKTVSFQDAPQWLILETARTTALTQAPDPASCWCTGEGINRGMFCFGTLSFATNTRARLFTQYEQRSPPDVQCHGNHAARVECRQLTGPHRPAEGQAEPHLLRLNWAPRSDCLWHSAMVHRLRAIQLTF